jgi:NADH:ubiquinone oxidoreductase subunit H
MTQQRCGIHFISIAYGILLKYADQMKFVFSVEQSYRQQNNAFPFQAN